ncbi:MAG: DUF1804 family protein [Magnetococcales bacterium]|nr:DUF1804 family protein [Magnetococcales bacterium]
MNDDCKSIVTPQPAPKNRIFAEKVQQAVKNAYRENGGNLTQAARAHGVSVSAARRWRDKDRAANRDWDHGQAASVNWLAECNRESLVGDLLVEYLEMHMEAIESVKCQVADPLHRVNALSRLSQALDRTMRSLGKASPELSRLAVAQWVLTRQAEFVRNHCPDHLPVLLEILEPFGEALLREVGR